MPKVIEDILTTIVTPLTMTDSLNIPALEMQVNHRLEAGSAIFYGSTNGEFFVSNEQEKFNIIQICVDGVTGRTPVATHIGEISTRETIRLGQQIERPDVDAVPVIVPYLVPLKQEELIAHYDATADALSILMFLYSILARIGDTIQPEATRALALRPNIIGIEDSVGSNESLKGFLDVVHDIDGFDVLNGSDPLIHKGFVEGRSTCISELASITPREINTVWSRFHADDIGGLYETQKSVTGLHTDLYKVAFSPVAMKETL